jgi:hypothetical protein
MTIAYVKQQIALIEDLYMCDLEAGHIKQDELLVDYIHALANGAIPECDTQRAIAKLIVESLDE